MYGEISFFQAMRKTDNIRQNASMGLEIDHL